MRIGDLSDRESGVFGPGTDLVVSLAAVLMLLLALKSLIHEEDLAELKKARRLVALKEQNDTLLRKVRENQMAFVAGMAAEFDRDVKEVGDHTYGLDIGGSEDYDIVFYGEAHRQRITFGSHLLFEPDGIVLSRTGGGVLASLRRAVKGQEDLIREIHIEGHADSSRTERYNLNLASRRAIAVFEKLVRLGMDPYRTIMSATSYGEYLSVNRFRSEEAYSKELVNRDNVGTYRKQRNRRIEVLLVYRLKPAPGSNGGSG